MGTKRVCAMRSFCLALLLALVASVPIEQTHSVMETLPAKKFMIQVGNDLQNSELEESEPDQAVRGGWDLEQYWIKQTIKGNFGAISGPLACTSVCRVWTPKRTGALRPRRICLPKTKPMCARDGTCNELCAGKVTATGHKSCMEGCAIYCDLK